MNVTVETAGQGNDVLGFISSLVGSLAWPVAIVLLAIIFRGQVKGLLAQLQTVAFGPASATFIREGLWKAEELAGTLPPSPPTAALPEPEGQDVDQGAGQRVIIEPTMFNLLVDESPQLAIVHMWKEVLGRLIAAAERFDVTFEDDEPDGLDRILSKLMAKKAITSNVVLLIETLQSLRNRAAHVTGGGVTALEAYRYREIAEDTIAALDRAHPRF